MPIDWMSQAQALREELVAHRRDFHQHPEIAFEEVRTAGIVAKELGALGLEVITGVGKTGVIGILDGQRDGPTILVRCDMDALPILEANTTEYTSQTPGRMHACGHDGHTAIALGVAKMLASQRDKLAGRVKFVFQPAEEIGLGAFAMINDGVLGDPAPQVALGLHLWPELPVGKVSVTPGPAMASCDVFSVKILGAGGHGGIPEQTRDPIVAGAQIVSALQTIVSRNVGGPDTAVLSVTTFHGGDAKNVIPSQAEITGTFRAYKQETRDLITRRLREVATAVASAFQCEAEVEIVPQTPPLVNDPSVAARVYGVLSRVSTPLQLLDDVRTMGAEDMSVFLGKIPGTYMFVGSANHERHLDYPLHHARFDIDEDALPIGAGVLASAVADYLVKD